MPLIYITGISGSGKSTVSDELNKRGYESHDADEEGYSYWHDKKSHKIYKNLGKFNAHTPEFHQKYEWLMIRSKVEELAERAKDKTIFLCGVTGNEKEMFDLFSKVIELSIDEKTLRYRIATRDSNHFGKAPHELVMLLGWYKSIKPAPITIDATKSLGKVVGEIIRLSK